MIAEIIDTDWHWLVNSLGRNRALPARTGRGWAAHPDPSVRCAVVVGSERAARGVRAAGPRS